MTVECAAWRRGPSGDDKYDVFTVNSRLQVNEKATVAISVLWLLEGAGKVLLQLAHVKASGTVVRQDDLRARE